VESVVIAWDLLFILR